MSDRFDPESPDGVAHASPAPPRTSGWVRLAIAGTAAGIVGVLFLLYVVIENAREAAARSRCVISQITLTMHSYNDTHGHLPPAALRDKDGRPLLSWRVLILPFIEEGALYDQFRLDEPWDSAHNIRLLERMPRTYAAAWTKEVKVPAYHTVMHVFVGKGAAFEERVQTKMPTDFPDGLSNTILIVEGGDPVPWTKPEDIPFDAAHPVHVRGLFKNYFRVGMGDGSMRLVRHDLSETTLRAAITRSGGEQLGPDW
jgi:hypothetical protein